MIFPWVKPGSYIVDEVVAKVKTDKGETVELIMVQKWPSHAQGRAGALHPRAGSQAGGLLIDLDGSLVAGHVQNFSDQTLKRS